MAGGAVVSAMYSASSGGYTNDTGAFPAVPDEGDQYSPLPDRHTGPTTLPVSTIEAAYPQIGSLQLLRVTARNGLGEDGGRVRSMDIVGTAATVTVTGAQFQGQLGLRSDWFTVPNACDGRVVPPLTALPAPDAGRVPAGDARRACSTPAPARARPPCRWPPTARWRCRSWASAGCRPPGWPPSP